MHPYLKEVLETKTVLTPEGSGREINSQISIEEGLFLQRIIREIQPRVSLEIGVAFGVSSMFICEALREVGAHRHICIDIGPLRKRETGELDRYGLGLLNLERCGYGNMIESYEMPSELALPELLQEGRKVDFVFIDGWHSFDHCLLDFFYANRLLNVGGAVAFHDADGKPVMKAIRCVSRYPAYRLLGEVRKRRVIGAAHRQGIRVLGGYVLDLLRLLQPNPPTCVALRKVAEDERTWSWYKDF
ncbi:MAG TPA: class I SAM-dependent methyltransferase [Syntrophales bacterium]|nr:class I SAM-dependent methyltransferase [Syntrophales bacterium]